MTLDPPPPALAAACTLATSLGWTRIGVRAPFSRPWGLAQAASLAWPPAQPVAQVPNHRVAARACQVPRLSLAAEEAAAVEAKARN